MDKKRAISLVMAGVLSLGSLTGCSGALGTDPTKIPLQNPLTKQEVLDYYAESLAYDTVVRRDIEEKEVSHYVLKPVTDSNFQSLVGKALAETQKYLSSGNFKEDSKNHQYMTDSLYIYVRSLLNDKKLTNGEVKAVYQALGYYFVDVEYDIQPGEIGTFTDKAALIGINGAFMHSSFQNKDIIDESYMKNALEKSKEYFENNKLDKMMVFDVNTGVLKIGSKADIYGAPAQVTTPVENTTVETSENTKNETAGETEKSEETAVNDVQTTETDYKEEEKTESTILKVTPDRAPRIDVKEFHKIAGSTRKAYIPDIELVYNIPKGDGLNGSGMYPSGGCGLQLFGMSRSGITGKMTLRYVFKSSLTDPYNLSIYNIYATNYEIKSGVNLGEDDASLIPEFLKTNFDILIDRADRAIMDVDITALSNGDIFTDLGEAVLVGYSNKGANLLRQMSTMRRVIARDKANNAYLVEVETFRQEGAKSADTYGSYKDKVYMVIQQDGEKFVISDYMIMSRQLVTAPDINPDASVEKRVVALGLSQAVPEDTKTAASEVVKALYDASTGRMLYGPWTDENGIEHEKGMYDCFNDNPSMLSSARKEEINATLRNYLIKHGINIASTMTGTITEWLGGTNNQVEFTTEELITYQGRNDAVYMNCYYLMSCMEDVWVIDEIRILDKQELTDQSQIQAVQSRIN